MVSNPIPFQDRRPVPVRTILATIGLLLATALLLYIVVTARQVLTWIIVGAFFAVALYPLVGFVQRRVFRGKKRSLATLLVFLVVFIVLAALITAFVLPLTTEGTKLAGQLPGIINDARNGKGPIGGLLDRTHALQWVQTHQSTIKNFASGLTTRELVRIAHGDARPAPDEEQRLRNLYAVASMLASRDGAGSAYAFLTEPNEELGGRSPASLLHDGRKPESVWFAAAPAF